MIENFPEILAKTLKLVIIFLSFLAATKQLKEHLFLSVCLSVCLSHLFHYVPVIVSPQNF